MNPEKIWSELHAVIPCLSKETLVFLINIFHDAIWDSISNEDRELMLKLMEHIEFYLSKDGELPRA